MSPDIVKHTSPAWPIYHLSALPEEGMASPYDTNGCIFWKGRYHLMYIYQDPALPHGGHCWGHWSSVDLVNWDCHPPALVPRPGDPDKGIFSGNAFINRDGVPMLCWFGIDAGVCLATAVDDELIEWRKHPRNPVIPMPKNGEPGFGVYRVWDPFLWLEGDTYYCLLGGNRLPGGKDTLYAMRSKDLTGWEAVGPFYEHRDPNWTFDAEDPSSREWLVNEAEDCSCPDFFRLGDKHVLMCISHHIGARCYVGAFDARAGRFTAERHERMNWRGGMFFAPESLVAPDGRRIFWAWVTDPRLRAAQEETGSGVQSLPRVLALNADGSLHITPAVELESLRRGARGVAGVDLPAGTERLLPEIQGVHLELAVEFEPGAAAEIGLKVFCSPDGSEETRLYYDAGEKTLVVDMSRSTLRKDVSYGLLPPFGAGRIADVSENKRPLGRVAAPFELRPGEPLCLRVFLDGSMLEVFANQRQCVTQQIFPSRPDAQQIKAFAAGASARLVSLQAWDMAPARFTARRPA